MDQVILLRLGGDNLVKRSILVEEEVGISVSQNTRALRRQHKQLVASVRYEKRPTPVFSTIKRMSGRGDLLFTSLIVFPRNVLVAFRSELIRRVVSDGR